MDNQHSENSGLRPNLIWIRQIAAGFVARSGQVGCRVLGIYGMASPRPTLSLYAGIYKALSTKNA